MAAPHSLTAIGTDPDALEAFYREHVEAVQRFVARRAAPPSRSGWRPGTVGACVPVPFTGPDIPTPTS